MVLKLSRLGAVVSVLLAVVACFTSVRQSLAAAPGAVTGNLFYNYYVPPDPHWGIGAQMYVAPRPTPPWVGHTFITYEPLAPQEFLYPHHRKYYRVNPGVGTTTVSVRWHLSPFHWAPHVDKGKYHDVPRLPFTAK